MGYSSITVEPGFHLFTATFEDVAGNEYKINDIKILNEDGSAWDVKSTTEMACNIQKMTTDGKGAYDSSKIYAYRHYYKAPPPKEVDNGLGWYVGSTTTRTPGNITLKNGEGLSINNQLTVPIKLQFSGAVTLTGRSFRVGPGYSLVGNLTPVDVNLNDVKILNAEGEVIDIKDASTVPVVITKMTTDGKGKYDSNQTYSYRHAWIPIPPPAGTDSGLGWYVGSTTTRIGNNITIPSGEAVSINNQMNYDIIVEFPSPIKEEAK